MTKRTTHIVFGIGISMLFTDASDPVMLALAVAVAILGGTIPDWDSKASHRGTLHNIFALTLTSSIIMLTSNTVAFQKYALSTTLSYFLAYSSHLLLDLLTGNVKLLYPFNKKGFHLTKIKYDEPMINVVLLAFGILMILVKL